MLHQVGVSFDLYYDARKHKIKMYCVELKRNSVRAGMMVEERHTYSWIFISRIKNYVNKKTAYMETMYIIK